jgi:hypothetical protein
MSLATILWERKKKKSVFDSVEAITRGVSCREESSTSSNRCFWTCHNNQPTSTTRLSSSFIRSKGDAFYLVDGAQHQRPSAAAAVHLADGFQQDRDKIMAANGDTKRRCSDPDLIIRRRMNLVNHSIGDLRYSSSSVKEEPVPNIFVVVSIPDGTTTVNETVGGNRQLFESTRRQHSLIFDKTIDNKDRRHHQQQQSSGFGHQQHNSLSCPLISP